MIFSQLFFFRNHQWLVFGEKISFSVRKPRIKKYRNVYNLMSHNPLINSNNIYTETKPNPAVWILKQCLNTHGWRYACNNNACFRNYLYTDNKKWVLIVKKSHVLLSNEITNIWLIQTRKLHLLIFLYQAINFGGTFFCNKAIKAIAFVLLLLFVWVYFAQLNDVLCFI